MSHVLLNKKGLVRGYVNSCHMAIIALHCGVLFVCLLSELRKLFALHELSYDALMFVFVVIKSNCCYIVSGYR